MYATSFCRHCVDAREFMQSKGIEYEEYLLDLMPHEKDAMIQRIGGLVHVAEFLDIPIIITEQAPDKIGKTIPIPIKVSITLVKK